MVDSGYPTLSRPKTRPVTRGALVDSPRGIGSRPVARALSVPEPDRSPTPSIVDAGFHEVLVLLDAGVEDELVAFGRRPRELVIAGAESQVIVFDLRGPIVEEGVFYARAQHPPPLGFVAAERRQDTGTGIISRQIIFIVCPSGTAFAVDQRAIEREAQSARDRTTALTLQFAGRGRRSKTTPATIRVDMQVVLPVRFAPLTSASAPTTDEPA